MGLFKKKKDFLHIEVKQLVEWNEKAFEDKNFCSEIWFPIRKR